MSVAHESTTPAPHLPQTKTSSWPSTHNPYDYPTLSSSLAPVFPESLDSYLPIKLEDPVSSQSMNASSTPGWYAPAALTSECSVEAGYTLYSNYEPPLTSSITFSPPTPTMPYAGKLPMPLARINSSLATFSPVSVHSRDSVVPESRRPSEEPQHELGCVGKTSSTHVTIGLHPIDRPHSSPNLLQPSLVEAPWTMNPLGIHTPAIQQDPYYLALPSLIRSSRLSVPLVQLPSNHILSPQPQRLWTPIAPQPLETPRVSGVKRSRKRNSETPDEPKRRKRSDSNESQQLELSQEDKLLLQLKEEEGMPWKDVAARFQSELGKSYQIPALQMRLKRLRERMRMWTEVDVKALRMANEYWSQHKFDIIAQKMLEFGAQERWTPRQCLRKWSEIDSSSVQYGRYDSPSHHEYAPCQANPVEQSCSFLPHMPVQ